MISLLVSDFQRSWWSVPSISVAVLGLQDTAEQVRAEYSLGHVKVEVGKDWIQEFLTCQLSTTLRKIDAKNMAAKSQRTKKITMTDKKNSSNQHSTTFCDAFYTFSNFSCMLLNPNIFSYLNPNCSNLSDKRIL